MNQTIGAYLDCFVFILIGGFMLTLGRIKMLRICGALVLLAGLSLLAMRLLSKSG